MLECLLVYFIGGNAHLWNVIELIILIILVGVPMFCRLFMQIKGSCRDTSFSASWEVLPTSCSSCFLHFLYLRSSNALPFLLLWGFIFLFVDRAWDFWVLGMSVWRWARIERAVFVALRGAQYISSLLRSQLRKQHSSTMPVWGALRMLEP